MIPFTLKVLTSQAEMVNAIQVAITLKVNNAVNSSIRDIVSSTKLLVVDTIEASPEYSSLLNGRLRAELGLATPEPALRAIIEALNNGIQVNYVPLRAGNAGSLTIELS